MKNIAIFASGSGSNFQEIVNKVKTGAVHAKIAFLVCDKPNAGVLNRAQQENIPAYCFQPKNYENKEQYELDILSKLKELNVDFIVLAGYMRLVGTTLLQAYPSKIVNIHPSLLPAFPGKHAIEQALEAGVNQTGVTIHFVDEGMDTGPIIAQEAVEITSEDSLETVTKKIQKVEHTLYPAVLHELLFKLTNRGETSDS